MIIGKTRTNQPVEDGGVVDARIKALVEGGTLSNAKPLYYHPIIIDSALSPESGEPAFSFSLAILNNDPTPFTFASFIAWVENLVDESEDDAIINTSGFYNNGLGTEVTSVSYLLCAEDKSWRIRGGTTGQAKITNITVSKSDFASLPVQLFSDAVNKIN